MTCCFTNSVKSSQDPATNSETDEYFFSRTFIVFLNWTICAWHTSINVLTYVPSWIALICHSLWPDQNKQYLFWKKSHQKFKIFIFGIGCWILSQFYIQLLYRPHLGTWILPFGLMGSKWKNSETTEFLLKYATFWGGFFMFSWAKI